ncbi:MAG: hypothetical protein HZC40_26315 [Chloroflexi bacterium]|nr:hypothetical protein [Chloroflexota bacterium]
MTFDPVFVSPLHDPDGVMLAHLATITPQLKNLFARMFVDFSDTTARRQSEPIHRLTQDSFFAVSISPPNRAVGDQFVALYKLAAASCAPQQILHLCFPDRVAFALQTHYRDQFIADVCAVANEDAPVLFQRSESAWRTHPQNYRACEQLATQVGAMLLGKSFDWTWCHLAAPAHRLADILPRVTTHDFTVLAEIVFALKDILQTQDVDWLAWEDPHIFARDADELKTEREASFQETRKRLAYVLPMIQYLYASTK